MKYALGNMLNGAGSINPDGLALDLQFAADKTLTARRGPTPIFTRASSGTFVGSNGLIQSAGNNVARFDHDPVTRASKGLLIEGSRTNQSLYSGALVANTGWGSIATTSIIDGLGPDGNNAYQVSETTATSLHILGNSGGTGADSVTSVTSGTTYTGSIFLKKIPGSIDWIQVTLGPSGFGNAQYANFNIGNGTVGNSAGLAIGTSPRIENYGNGWYRCSISVTATTTTTTSVNTIIGFIQNTNGTTRLPSYTGSTSNQILAAMCQFEAGSFATSYIPTTTASVVRSADVCSITGAAFSGIWNPSEGSTFFNGISAGRGSGAFGSAAFFLDIASSTVDRLSQYATSIGTIRPEFKRNNIDQYVPTAITYGNNTVARQSVGFRAGETSSAFFNNTAFSGGTNIALTMPSVNGFYIGSSSIPGNFCNGTIASIRYYRKRLSNAKLQALTV